MFLIFTSVVISTRGQPKVGEQTWMRTVAVAFPTLRGTTPWMLRVRSLCGRLALPCAGETNYALACCCEIPVTKVLTYFKVQSRFNRVSGTDEGHRNFLARRKQLSEEDPRRKIGLVMSSPQDGAAGDVDVDGVSESGHYMAFVFWLIQVDRGAYSTREGALCIALAPRPRPEKV